MVLHASAGVGALQTALRAPGDTVDLAPGERWLIKSGRLEPAEGVTLNANGAEFYCPESAVRLVTVAPRVTVRGLNARGAFTLYNYASKLTVEDTTISHSLDGATYLPLGKKGGATGAFMNWLNLNSARTMTDLVFRRCTADHAYHHGFGMSLMVQEGGGFKNVLFEDCRALSCGSGLESTGTGQTGDRDWSTGYDIPDTGDIENLTYRGCQAVDSWQSGFHMDGSWTGHRQIQKNVLLEDCLAVDSGRRSGVIPGELYQSGYYLQTGTLRRCRSQGARKAGFHLKNGEPNSLVLTDCSSTGDAYGLVIEYGGVGAMVTGFVAEKNTRRALQATAQRADIDITIRDFKGVGRPVLLGITERLEMVDSTKPGNVKTLAVRRKDAKPFNGRLVITAATAHDLIDVHPPSQAVVSFAGIGYRALHDVVVPPVIPNPIPQGNLWCEDGWIWIQPPEGRVRQLVRLPDELQAGTVLTTQDGWVYASAPGVPTRQMWHLSIDEQPHFMG